MSEKLLNDDVLNDVSGGASTAKMVKLGTATVLTTDLRIRKEPNTNSTVMGMTNAPAKYDVYEIVQNEGYIWYRIAGDKWIANDGTWVRFQTV